MPLSFIFIFLIFTTMKISLDHISPSSFCPTSPLPTTVNLHKSYDSPFPIPEVNTIYFQHLKDGLCFLLNTTKSGICPHLYIETALYTVNNDLHVAKFHGHFSVFNLTDPSAAFKAVVTSFNLKHFHQWLSGHQTSGLFSISLPDLSYVLLPVPNISPNS